MGLGVGYAQSTRTMGQLTMNPTVGAGSNAPGLHGVLSSNVIPNQSNFTSSYGNKNSGIVLGQMPLQGQISGNQMGITKPSTRLHTSQGARGVGGSR